MTNTKSFRASKELDKALQNVSSELGLTISDTIIKLLEESLNLREKDKDSDSTFLKNACPALVELEDGYHCVIKAPQQKKLGDGSLKDARLICEAHDEIMKLKNENQLLKNELSKVKVIKIPSCMLGGRLSEDGTQIHCPRGNVNRNVDVENWCKILKNGANCDHLNWSTIEVKGKLPTPDL